MRCSHFWVWGRVVSVPENVLSDTHWGDSNCIGRSCCTNFLGFGVGFGSVPQKRWSDTRWVTQIALVGHVVLKFLGLG